MDGNLLDPIVLRDEEIKAFMRTHKCGLCGSHLMHFPAPKRMWYVHCPNCGRCTADMVVKTSTSERVARTRRQALHELQDPEPKPQSPDEIIKSLGF